MSATTQKSVPRSAPLGRRFGRIPILMVQCIIVVACVAVTTLAATGIQEQQLRAATEERVLAVARSLADLDQVQEAIGTDNAGSELQPLADIIAQASGVDFVVITDDAGLRLTHPRPSLRGLPTSTDATQVLQGIEYLGTETGTIGPTLRAKAPVWREGEIIGTTSVGILESEIDADRSESLFALLPWVLGAAAVGTVAAAMLTRVLTRRVRRLENDVAELEVQRRLARALREQTHEFRTQLHSVYGLVESGNSSGALSYIADLVPVGDRQISTAEINDSRLAALLAAAAGELQIRGGELRVDPLSTVAAGALNDADVTVVSNLVWNAIEAVEPTGKVQVTVHADESRVEVVVDDNGPGVDPVLGQRLFDRGFSTKLTESGEEPRGIGLHLVMRTVTHRGGHVDIARSRLGGAAFTVSMPTSGDGDRTAISGGQR